MPAFKDYNELPSQPDQGVGELTSISSDKFEGIVELNKVISQLKLADTDVILKFADKCGVTGKNVVNYFNKHSYVPQVGAGEKPVKLILNDALAPIVGSYTAAGLGLLIQAVGTGMQRFSALDLMFPNKTVESYNSWLDRMKPATGIMSEYGGDNAMLSNVRPLDTYTVSYTPGIWGNKLSLNSKMMTFGRELGGKNLDGRGIGQRIAYNMEYLYKMGYTRKKYSLVEMLFNNGYTYAGGIQASNIPAANYIEMYESMGTLNVDGSVTYSTTDPTYTPMQAISSVLNNPIFIKYREAVSGIYVNHADMMAMVNHPNVKPVTNYLAMGALKERGKVKVVMDNIEQELNTYWAPGFDIPFLSDGDVWENQNNDGTPNNASQQFFVPRGAMMIVLDFKKLNDVKQRQFGAYHLCYNEVDPNSEAPAMGFFAGTFSRNLNNSNVTNQLDLVVALAGNPAMYMPEACFFITGLYSNVSMVYNTSELKIVA
jgi:hypothetical protein